MFDIDDKYGISITCGDTAALELTFTGDPPGENDQVIRRKFTASSCKGGMA